MHTRAVPTSHCTVCRRFQFSSTSGYAANWKMDNKTSYSSLGHAGCSRSGGSSKLIAFAGSFGSVRAFKAWASRRGGRLGSPAVGLRLLGAALLFVTFAFAARFLLEPEDFLAFRVTGAMIEKRNLYAQPAACAGSGRYQGT